MTIPESEAPFQAEKSEPSHQECREGEPTPEGNNLDESQKALQHEVDEIIFEVSASGSASASASAAFLDRHLTSLPPLSTDHQENDSTPPLSTCDFLCPRSWNVGLPCLAQPIESYSTYHHTQQADHGCFCNDDSYNPTTSTFEQILQIVKEASELVNSDTTFGENWSEMDEQ